MVINYIFEQQTINPSADNNWSFAPVNGDVNVTFEMSPKAQTYAADMDIINFVSTLDSGFATYSINLSAATDEAVEEEASEDTTKEDLVYVVQEGDMLWKIAEKHGLKWEELAKHNKLNNPHLIYVGQKLLIPQK